MGKYITKKLKENLPGKLNKHIQIIEANEFMLYFKKKLYLKK